MRVYPKSSQRNEDLLDVNVDDCALLVLAAGKGVRMNSNQPKVLRAILGTPMISRVLDNVLPFFRKHAIVIGHKSGDVKKVIGLQHLFILQDKQLGTGHAVACAKGVLENDKDISSLVVIPGDHPLLKGETLVELVKKHKREKAVITLATVMVSEFSGDAENFYTSGRILRNKHGEVDRIVELREASSSERSICEVNVSYYCFDAKWLWNNIGNIQSKNSAREYYLTDIVHMAVKQKKRVLTYSLSCQEEGLGVNTIEQQRVVEKYL